MSTPTHRSGNIYEWMNRTVTKCRICEAALSGNALSRASHGRKHVRAGEAVEKMDSHFRTIFVFPPAPTED